MLSNLIITYASGSGGEILSAPLINTGRYSSPLQSHRLTEQGRMVPDIDINFVNLFKPQRTHFYTRNWHDDWNILEQLDKPWLLLIPDTNQVAFLKEKFQNRVQVLSINYDTHLWLFVADSFCRKILDAPNYLTDTITGANFLDACSKSTEQRDWFIKLGQSGQLGRWYMQNLLSGNLHYPPKQVQYPGDVNIDLATILQPGGLATIYQNLALDIVLDYSEINNMHTAWLNLQTHWAR
jgi:hypothetical protein